MTHLLNAVQILDCQQCCSESRKETKSLLIEQVIFDLDFEIKMFLTRSVFYNQMGIAYD